MGLVPENPRAFEVTHRSVAAIAWPTTLAYMSVPLLGLVDTGVVGNLGDAELLGGLAVGAVLFDVVFGTLNFLRSSTTGLVAQAEGAGDREAQRAILIRSLLLSLFLGVAILIVAPLFLTAGLWAMNVSPAVERATSIYFTIRILAAPLTLINFAVLGWLLGQGKAGLGLLLQIALNGTNIVLSILLGLVLEWGLEGVAWATIIAEGFAACCGLFLTWFSYKNFGAIPWRRVLNRAALQRLMSVNQDILIRSLTLMFAFAFFASQGGKLGDTTLAANAVLMNFFLFGGYFLDGFAIAAEQLAGKAVGAKYRPAFDKTVRLTLIWGFILSGVAFAVFYFSGPLVIDIMTNNQAVRASAQTYLIWAALTPLIGVVAFQMDGVFIGATWSADMRNMMLLSLIAYLLTWWIAMPLWGNHGLWLALEVFLGFRGISLYARLPLRARETFG